MNEMQSAHAAEARSVAVTSAIQQLDDAFHKSRYEILNELWKQAFLAGVTTMF